MTEDKARDRVESGDSERERNAVIRPQEPAAARMDFFNGLQKGVAVILNGSGLRRRKLRSPVDTEDLAAHEACQGRNEELYGPCDLIRIRVSDQRRPVHCVHKFRVGLSRGYKATAG